MEKSKSCRIYFESSTMEVQEWNSLIKGFHELLQSKGVEKIKNGSESSKPFEGKIKRTYSLTFFEKDEQVAIDAVAYFQDKGIEMEGRNGTLH